MGCHLVQGSYCGIPTLDSTVYFETTSKMTRASHILNTLFWEHVSI